MTIQETQKLMTVIAETYQSFKPKEPKETLRVWAWALEPYDFVEIQKGLAAYIRNDTTGYAPAPGQLIGRAQETLSGEMSDGEAWGKVIFAMRNGTYGAEAEFSKLPEAVQRAVGSPQVLTQWAQLEEHMLTGVEASFKRAYKTECARETARRSIGGAVRITGSMAPRAIETVKEPERTITPPITRKADIEAIERRVEEMWQAKEA